MGQLRLLGEPPTSDDHAALANLAFAGAGHTGFVAAAGLAGGQTIIGGTAPGEYLSLQSTAGSPRGVVQVIDSLRLVSGLIQDSGGNPRLALATASPHVTLTGNVRVDERLGIATDPDINVGLKMRPTFAGVSGYISLLDFAPAGLSLGGPTTAVDGIHCDATFSVTGYNVSRVAGLYFFGYVTNMPGDTLSDLMAVYARVGNQSMYGALTRAAGLHVETPAWYGDNYPTTYYGLRIKQPWTSGDGSTAVGILCEDACEAANNYTAWLGAPLSGTPRLRLDAGTPAANQTMLYLAEGVTPTVRRVQWKLYSALVAADKVMVLV